MSPVTKPKAILLRDPSREDLLLKKLDLVLQKLADVSEIDAAQVQSAQDFLSIAGELPPDTVIFLEASLITDGALPFQPEWSDWNVVLVRGDLADASSKDASEKLQAWKKVAGYLDLTTLPLADLPRVLQVVLSPDRFPGIFALSDKESEIYYEKILSLAEVGLKADRFIALLEKRYPELAPQLFNLRQLSYSILHEGFLAASAVTKVAAVVDFQITANSNRIAFAARFNAGDKVLNGWIDGIAKNTNLVWYNARLSADALIMSELTKLKQIEVKALISQGGQFSNAKNKTFLFSRFEDFHPDGVALEAQRTSKFVPLASLNVEAKADNKGTVVKGGEAEKTEEEKETENGLSLSYKLKADMLEQEKANLQGLVKKKNALITGLNKDVNRAQREVLSVQKDATKELQQMRMETEKAKNEAREATKKLVVLQKKLAEKEAAEKVAQQDQGPKRDYDKELKQLDVAKRAAEEKLAELNTKFKHQDEMLQKIRKEHRAALAEANELKAKVVKLEQSLEAKSREEKVTAGVPVDSPQTSNVTDSLAEKLKDSQRIISESKVKEQEVAKETKQLKLKLEAAEKNLKIKMLEFEKQAKATERLLEEARRQKSEATRKMEEQMEINRKKIEETNASERIYKKEISDLKAKVDELTAQLNNRKAS